MPIRKLHARTQVYMRLAVRLTGTGAHLVLGLSLVTFVFPWVSPARRSAIQQHWARLLLTILGVRLAVRGPGAATGLLIANHITWLDVFVINAVTRPSFVCKSDVSNWPVFGFLCARAGTIFIERNRRSAARRVNQDLVDKLSRGEQIAVFPEGTTGDGIRLLTFRAALLQSAIDAEGVVQPLALHYANHEGDLPTHFAYCGETTFWQSLCAIAAAPKMTAHLSVLDAIPATALTRRELAEQAQSTIQAVLKKTGATKGIEDIEYEFVAEDVVFSSGAEPAKVRC